MSEQPQRPDLRLLKFRLSEMAAIAQTATEDFVQDSRYRLAVPAETRERSSNAAGIFAGEALDYLNQNPYSTLKLLGLDSQQLTLVYLLTDAYAKGNLVLKSTLGRINRQTGAPYLVKHYHTQKPAEMGYDPKTESTLVLRWNGKREFPLGFSVIGITPRKSPGTLTFLTFSQKAETSDQVLREMGWVNQPGNEAGVYQGGKRIITNRTMLYKGREIQSTSQYFLIGAFDGAETHKTYWLYGSNDRHNTKTTVREGVSEKQTAKEESHG